MCPECSSPYSTVVPPSMKRPRQQVPESTGDEASTSLTSSSSSSVLSQSHLTSFHPATSDQETMATTATIPSQELV